MYCANCGKANRSDAKFCMHCGMQMISNTSVNTNPNIVNKHIFNKPAVKLIVACFALIIGVISIFSFVESRTYLNGAYECLDGNRSFVLKHKNKDSGTFELYYDGETADEENMRYIKTWKKEGDILTLVYDDDDVFYFLVVDEGLIMLEDEDDKPEFSEYIAPKGSTFEYEINDKIFHADGTYEYEMTYFGTATGKYYCENNIIYCKNDSFSGTESTFGNTAYYQGESEYSPEFWIYNDNYITRAYNAYIKTDR